jgi:VWFA-related protein
MLSTEESMVKRHGTAVVGIIGLLLVGPALSAPAGDPRPAAQTLAQSQDAAKPLQYEVNVVLKLLQVHVTDKKGRPVRDLVREDFVVTDNGQPVELTAFEKHALSDPAPQPPVREVEGAAAPAAAGGGDTARVSGRKFFLLFDFAYNNVRGVEKAQKAALHFMDDIVQPEDQVAVLSYAAIGGLAFQEYLTTDHAQVRKALQAFSHKDIKGRATEIEDYYWRFVQSSGGPFVLNLRAEAEANRHESRDMALKYMETLTDLARALRLVEGEKDFILFSTGIPNSLVYGYATNNTTIRSDVRPIAGDDILRRQNEAMYKEFSAAGCALYAFDTRESAKEVSLFGYDEETFAMGSRAMTTAIDPTWIFKDDKATGLNSLKRFTDQTGGRYYSNINMYERNLDQVQDATAAYYVLGYSINEVWDGQFHEVQVEVRRKGCEVRTQAGYFNPKPYAAYTDLEKRIHLFDLAINERSFSRIPGAVPMGAFSYAAGGDSKLVLVARVPGEMTARLTGPKAELVALFFDEGGDIAEIVRDEVATASWRGGDAVLAAGVTLRPGDYTGRLVLRDMSTGQSAVASVRATVGQPAGDGLLVGTPLLLAEGPGIPLREAAAKKAGEAPAFAEGYPYDPNRFVPVIGEAPPGTARLSVVIPCACPGGEPELLLSVRLLESVSGTQVPVTASLSGRLLRRPLEILTLELGPADLPAGTYYLHIYAEDKASGALGHAVTTLIIPSR